ncbi:hypothetical protein ACFQY9_02175 [Microvirga aerilata]
MGDDHDRMLRRRMIPKSRFDAASNLAAFVGLVGMDGFNRD